MTTTIKLQQPYVIDASVLIKPFLAETGYQKVEKLLDLHVNKEIALFAPSILIYELSHVLAKKIDRKSAKNGIKTFLKLDVGMIPLDYSGIVDVMEYALKFGAVGYYDASYYSLARSLNAKLITADKRFYNSVNDTEFVILLDNMEC